MEFCHPNSLCGSSGLKTSFKSRTNQLLQTLHCSRRLCNSATQRGYHIGLHRIQSLRTGTEPYSALEYDLNCPDQRTLRRPLFNRWQLRHRTGLRTRVCVHSIHEMLIQRPIRIYHTTMENNKFCKVPEPKFRQNFIQPKYTRIYNKLAYYRCKIRPTCVRSAASDQRDQRNREKRPGQPISTLANR